MKGSLIIGRRAAQVSIAATFYFLIAAATAQLVVTRYNFFSDYISDYAVGPMGWIYGSAFWASTIGCVSLAVALVQLVPPAALSRAGVVLMLLMGLTFLIDFFFPTDILAPGQLPVTLAGSIHLIDATVGWILFPVSAILLTSHFKRDPYWRTGYVPLITLGGSAIFTLGLLLIVARVKVPIAGLVEKCFILDRNVWSLWVASMALSRTSK